MEIQSLATGYAEKGCCTQAIRLGTATTLGILFTQKVLHVNLTRAFCQSALLSFTADHLIIQYGNQENLIPSNGCLTALALWVGAWAGMGWLLDSDPFVSGTLFGALPVFALNRLGSCECTGEVMRAMAEAEAESRRMDPVNNQLRITSAQCSITAKLIEISRQEFFLQSQSIAHPSARQIAHVRALQDRDTNHMNPSQLAAHAEAMEQAVEALEQAVRAGVRVSNRQQQRQLNQMQIEAQALNQRQTALNEILETHPSWIQAFAKRLPQKTLEAEYQKERDWKQQLAQEVAADVVTMENTKARLAYATTDEERFGPWRASAQFYDRKIRELQDLRATSYQHLQNLAHASQGTV